MHFAVSVKHFQSCLPLFLKFQKNFYDKAQTLREKYYAEGIFSRNLFKRRNIIFNSNGTIQCIVLEISYNYFYNQFVPKASQGPFLSVYNT